MEIFGRTDLGVEFDPQRCAGCARCLVEQVCPMKAVIFEDTYACRDESLCFHCGLCVAKCPSGAFRCNLGSIHMNNTTIPVVLRQSDRFRALMLARDLKRRILDGSFKIAEPVEKIV